MIVNFRIFSQTGVMIRLIYELKLYFLGFRDIFIWSQYVSPTLVYFVDINQSSVVSWWYGYITNWINDILYRWKSIIHIFKTVSKEQKAQKNNAAALDWSILASIDTKTTSRESKKSSQDSAMRNKGVYDDHVTNSKN